MPSPCRARSRQIHRESDAAGLPVRPAQHEMVDHVVKWGPLDRDAQAVHVREVRLAPLTRLVELRKEDLLAGTLQGPPLLHSTLERP